MRRFLLALLIVSAPAALSPAVASAATAPACTGTPVLKLRVDRDRSQRVVDFGYNGTSGSSAIQPVSMTVIRNGSSRTFQWRPSRDDYVYKAKRGEQARFLGVYLEDSSGYGAIGITQPGTLTVPIPGYDALSPLVAPVLGGLFPGGNITVRLPVSVTGGGDYGSRACARTLPLTVSEATAGRKARVRHRF